MLIGDATAEQIKIELGQSESTEEVLKRSSNGKKEVRGRDLVTGLPKVVEISDDEILDALRDTIHSIVELVIRTLEQSPPELAADIFERGIVLTGGGSLLRDIDKVLSVETKIPVFIAESPLECVVNGTAEILKKVHLLKDMRK